MTIFADLMTQANDAITAFLSDKEAVRLSAVGGTPVGDPIPVIFNDRPDTAFDMVAGSRLEIDSPVTLPAQTVLRIDGIEYITAPAVPDRGRFLIAVELAE